MSSSPRPAHLRLQGRRQAKVVTVAVGGLTATVTVGLVVGFAQAGAATPRTSAGKGHHVAASTHPAVAASPTAASPHPSASTSHSTAATPRPTQTRAKATPTVKAHLAAPTKAPQPVQQAPAPVATSGGS